MRVICGLLFQFAFCNVGYLVISNLEVCLHRKRELVNKDLLES